MITSALFLALTLSPGPGPHSLGPAPQACEAQQEWNDVIQRHLTRYPGMALADLYKLLHQGALGSEHAVETDMARQWLDEEIAVLAEGPPEILVDTIAPGGTHVRIHLRPYLEGGGDPEALLEVFVETANGGSGSMDGLACALATATAMANTGDLPWSAEVVQRFFTARAEQDYPAEHHTRPYWSAYRPAYRVVSGALAAQALATMEPPPEAP